MCGIPQCGTYSKKSKSTTSFYVVLVPHGIGEMVLIALTFNGVHQWCVIVYGKKGVHVQTIYLIGAT